MKIGLVQYDPVWESKEENKKHLVNILSSLNEKTDLLNLSGNDSNRIYNEF